MAQDYETFQLGEFSLQCGSTLPNAFIAYKTYGDASKPAILYPTWYSGFIRNNEWFVGKELALNPDKYFIIIPALFGNGQSTSPSNSPARPFPAISFHDNVKAQHQLVTHLGVKSLKAVLGWSMAAATSFQWAVQYPDFVERIVPWMGAARTSLHNKVFLEGQKGYLLSAQGQSSAGSGQGAHGAGQVRMWSEPQKDIALRNFARGYAGWGFSQAFYRKELFVKDLGFKDLEDFLKVFWEGWFLQREPENLLSMLQTWQNGDISQQEPFNGDFEKAMGSIKAKTLIVPCRTDLYFPPEDSEYELHCLAEGVGRLTVRESIYGHWAGMVDAKEDTKWLDGQLREWLEGTEWLSGLLDEILVVKETSDD